MGVSRRVHSCILAVCIFAAFSAARAAAAGEDGTGSAARMQEWLNGEMWWTLNAGSLEGVERALREGADVNARNAEGDAPIHRAARWNTAAAAALLIRYGADLAAREAHGWTPAGVAAAWRQYATLTALLDRGALIGVPVLDLVARDDARGLRKLLAREPEAARFTDRAMGTPARLAASLGHVAALRVLVESGADLQERADSGHTLLHYAAWGGHAETVEYLLAAGLEVDAAVGDGRTPLHCAIASGNAAAVRVLLAAGADLRREYWRQSAFLQAMSGRSAAVARTVLRAARRRGDLRPADADEALCRVAGRGWLALARRLVRLGADPDAECSSGGSPLLAAAMSARWDVVRFLLREGASPDARGDVGEDLGPERGTALFVAIRQGDAAAVRMLLGAGVSLEPTPPRGKAPMHIAAETGRTDFIAVLLEAGADPNARGTRYLNPWDERTPLLMAAEHGQTAAAAMLLEAGADITVVNYARESAFHLALLNGHRELATMLLERGHPVREPALALAATGAADELAAFVDRDAEALTTTDSVGWSALHWAAAFDRAECVRVLTDRGALVNDLVERRAPAPFLPRKNRARRRSRSGGREGITPLALAAANGCPGALEVLLDAGAEAFLALEGGYAPLHLAAEHGHAACIRLLAKHGAKVDAETRVLAATPLQLAAGEGHTAAAVALLDAGAGRTGEDRLKNTARGLAWKNGHTALAELLRERSKPH